MNVCISGHVTDMAVVTPFVRRIAKNPMPLHGSIFYRTGFIADGSFT